MGGGFQKGSLILLKIFSDEAHSILICRILENLRKKFSIGKKSDFKFRNRGYFPKKIFRKYLKTSVIISLLKDNLLYFGKKLQKKIK